MYMSKIHYKKSELKASSNAKLKDGWWLRSREMFILVFGIERHGPQLYFDICELSVRVSSWMLAPFLGSVRSRSRVMLLLSLPALAGTPRLELWPRPFQGATANLQTGNGFRVVVFLPQSLTRGSLMRVNMQTLLFLRPTDREATEAHVIKLHWC